MLISINIIKLLGQFNLRITYSASGRTVF